MTGLLDKWNLVKIAVADKNLNTAAKRVIVFLLDRENSKTGALFPSHLRISNDSNLHERSVRRGLLIMVIWKYYKKDLQVYPQGIKLL